MFSTECTKLAEEGLQRSAAVQRVAMRDRGFGRLDGKAMVCGYEQRSGHSCERGSRCMYVLGENEVREREKKRREKRKKRGIRER